MKKTTLFMLALLCLQLGYTQTSLGLEEQVAEATSQLNLSDCSSGIFTGKLPEYIPLEYYDGTYLSDSTIITKAEYLLMYGMLDKGHIASSPMFPIDEFWGEADSLSKRDTIELSGLYYDFHQFKKTAILILTSNHKFDTTDTGLRTDTHFKC